MCHQCWFTGSKNSSLAQREQHCDLQANTKRSQGINARPLPDGPRCECTCYSVVPARQQRDEYQRVRSCWCSRHDDVLSNGTCGETASGSSALMSVDLRSTRVDKSQLREFTRNRPHNKIWTALYASLRRSLRISSLRLHLCIYARLLRPRLYPRLLPPSPPPCTRLSDVSTYPAQLRPSVCPHAPCPAMCSTTQPYLFVSTLSTVPCERDYSEPYSKPYLPRPLARCRSFPLVRALFLFNSIRFCQITRLQIHTHTRL